MPLPPPPKRLLTTLAAALVGIGLAASPAAAEDTGFDFEEWFMTNVMSPKPADTPAVKIKWFQDDHDRLIYCEDRNQRPDGWCTGGYSPIFIAEVTEAYSAPERDLEIIVEWTTSTGLTGSGDAFGNSVIIKAGLDNRTSNPFAIIVPNDDIAHSCNKLIVTLRSLTPELYKIAPLNAGGSLFFEYVDDDGGNPDNEPC